LSILAFLLATVEREVPIYLIREYGFIHDLWVEDTHRQQGLARQLVQQAIAHFKQMGVEQVRLDTAAANETARKLFVACGFRVSVVEMLIEL
jgi:ribosomal protein S18 acetylase RimI-like enzyme